MYINPLFNKQELKTILNSTFYFTLYERIQSSTNYGSEKRIAKMYIKDEIQINNQCLYANMSIVSPGKKRVNGLPGIA